MYSFERIEWSGPMLYELRLLNGLTENVLLREVTRTPFGANSVRKVVLFVGANLRGAYFFGSIL